MSQAEEGTRSFASDLFKVFRMRRDTLMNAWAGVALRVSSSRPYFVISSALSRPALFVMGASRKPAAAAASQFLAQLNMPSREDVLALSTRLTRIEMALDDIGAAIDAGAAASGKSRAAPRPPQRAAHEGNGAARAG